MRPRALEDFVERDYVLRNRNSNRDLICLSRIGRTSWEERLGLNRGFGVGQDRNDGRSLLIILLRDDDRRWERKVHRDELACEARCVVWLLFHIVRGR